MSCNNGYAFAVGLFRGYISPIIFVLGLIGNVLVVWVFMDKKFKNRFATYGICLAISHCVILVVNSFLDDFLGRGLSYALRGSCGSYVVKVDIVSNLSCKVMQYIPEIMYFTTSWVMVAFSVDRVVTIFYPLRFYANNNTKIPITICILILLTGLIINIPIAISSGIIEVTKNNKSSLKCDLLTKTIYKTTRAALYSKIFLSFIIPVFAILLLNCVIIGKLLEIKRKSQALLPLDKSKSTLEMGRVIGHLSISSFFLLLMMPLVITMIVRLYWTDRIMVAGAWRLSTLSDLTRLFSSLKDISYTADFYIYLICLPNFKKTLVGNVQALPCCKKSCFFHRKFHHLSKGFFHILSRARSTDNSYIGNEAYQNEIPSQSLETKSSVIPFGH